MLRALGEAAPRGRRRRRRSRYQLRIIERDAWDERAHLDLIACLQAAAGRHGEARRRYGFYAAKMEEISVEAAPFPGSAGSGAGARAGSPGSLAAAPG